MFSEDSTSFMSRSFTGVPPKVIQFGAGNFLRAFFDWMIAILNEEADFNGSVLIVKPTPGEYSLLKQQKGRFTVVLDGVSGEEIIKERRPIDVIHDVITTDPGWKAFLQSAHMESIRFVVSNTTEAGIEFDKKDRREAPIPRTFPGKLTLWLYERYLHFEGKRDKGCIFLPCELIEQNGQALREKVLQYAAHWQLEEPFIHWIAMHNYFCDTLVDRIVSGYPKDRIASLQEEMDQEVDPLLVAGEYYHSWLIQGPEFIKKELPFHKTSLNVSFVDDLIPYRTMKVRVLNGAHTAMVPVGYLAGLHSVREVIENDITFDFVHSLLEEEVLATLDFPTEIKGAYVSDVLDRFRNPTLHHQLLSIALNSTSKFTTRLLPTLKDYHQRRQQLPQRIVLSLAALLRFYKGEWKSQRIELKDNLETITFIADLWMKLERKEMDLPTLTASILGNVAIWSENLNAIPGLTAATALFLSEIEREGIEKTIKNLNTTTIT